MRVVGTVAPGLPPVLNATVPHGKSPAQQLWSAGFVLVRPLSATQSDGEVVVTYLVAPATAQSRPPQRRRRIEAPPLSVQPGEVPVECQRLAAYGLVTSERGVLGTTIAAASSMGSLWWLPGGRIEPIESPADALIREAFEETGQHVVIDRFVDVLSERYLRRTQERLENYHALRLIYLAHCDDPTDPTVVDTGGSTGEARWVPVAEWKRLNWAATARSLLLTHLN